MIFCWEVNGPLVRLEVNKDRHSAERFTMFPGCFNIRSRFLIAKLFQGLAVLGEALLPAGIDLTHGCREFVTLAIKIFGCTKPGLMITQCLFGIS